MFHRLRRDGSERSTAPRSSTNGSISWKNANRPHMSVVLRGVWGVRIDRVHTVARGEAGSFAGVGLGVVMEVLQSAFSHLVVDFVLLGLCPLRAHFFRRSHG